ncbi:MAG: hypothetical protein ACO4AI_06995 [Prochlorothrix sp.]
MTRIVRSLETISAYFSQQNSLGFSDEVLHQVIYCDGVEGSTWYYRDSKDQQPVLIPTPVLEDVWKLQPRAVGPCRIPLSPPFEAGWFHKTSL